MTFSSGLTSYLSFSLPGLFYFHQLDGAVESAWHRFPLVVGGFLVIDVYDVDFLHLAPFHTLAVECSNAVGRQVGHFYADGVLALRQCILAVENVRHSPGAAYVMAVDVDAGTFAHVA